MKHLFSAFLLAVFCAGCAVAAPEPVARPITAAPSAGAKINYQLPTTGLLPQTYRVTLAITDPKNPDWIVSQFAAGVVRTVTAENGGKFSESWNGLDDNFLPVPPGQYGVKGIFMPAKKWDVDGEYHSVVPRYVTEASAWRSLPGEGKASVISGDPVNSPIGDVDVAANGMGVFCYTYLENAHNFYVADFKKPIDYDQVVASYNSGGAAGGNFVATDGTTSWCYENEGFLFRTDGKKFGNANGRYRNGVYKPNSEVTALAAWRDETTNKSFVYVAEKNGIKVLDGDSAEVLATLDVNDSRGLVARWGDGLWVLHSQGDKSVVSAVPLKNGLPSGQLTKVFAVPDKIIATDLEVDSHNRIYLADADANRVYQFTREGKPLLTLGKLAAQPSGGYDSQSFMRPQKLSCWRDAQGGDHLIVVEKDGPDRVSQWNADDGKWEREWPSAQTFANAGYAVDPRQADRIYMQGHGGYLMRFRVDYGSGDWKLEAVWPDVATGRFKDDHFAFPRVIYRGDTRYLAWSRGDFIYREEGNRWLPSAAFLNENGKEYLWHDANGDGKVDEAEYRPYVTDRPTGTRRYWGNSWLDDFSYAAIAEGSAKVWRLPVASFDAHGNPVYAPDGWKTLLTDPVLQARRDNTATALWGGNEIGDKFSSAWAMIEGDTKNGFYLNARGPDISANFGAQQKLSRYVPDGKGGYKIQWRVGRVALGGTAQPGEVYGSINVMPPIGGLVTQIDQSRMGVALYTEAGLYVDTLFTDPRVTSAKTAGVYNLPGEFFTGYSYLNPANDKVYLALGKTTPMIFEAEGWNGQSNSTRALETLPKTVSLAANEIAAAPEFALAVRRKSGAADAARVAQFAPLPGGGPALDGSMNGWESCEPINFSGGDKQNVEVRAGYDRENLYLRWHARLGRPFEAKPLASADRIFTHDRLADTLSFYIQGDLNAPPAQGNDARAGDVRLVFGIFDDAGKIRPVALGMYPNWKGPEKPASLTYKTPAGGAATFENVALLPDVKLGQTIDADNQGFVIAAAIPRSRVPMLPPVAGELRTLVNFDANLGGHNRFWWSNADGSASRETYDEPTEARLYPGSWSQAQFAAMNQLPIRTWSAIGPFGFAKLPQLDILQGRNEITKTLNNRSYPPQEKIDLAATYNGDVATTRDATRTLKWKTVNISGDLISLSDVLNWKGNQDEGSAYLATWIYAATPTPVKLRERDKAGHHALRGWLNDVALPTALPPNQNADSLHQALDSSAPVTLQVGWNKLLLRYDFIWGTKDVGVILDAPPGQLWALKFSATPPVDAATP